MVMAGVLPPMVEALRRVRRRTAFAFMVCRQAKAGAFAYTFGVWFKAARPT
jgi:hypothetical protein